jgi:hypothetical protein
MERENLCENKLNKMGSVNIVLRSRKHCYRGNAKIHSVFSPDYFINGTIFGGKIIEDECILVFSTTLV